VRRAVQTSGAAQALRAHAHMRSDAKRAVIGCFMRKRDAQRVVQYGVESSKIMAPLAAQEEET